MHLLSQKKFKTNSYFPSSNTLIPFFAYSCSDTGDGEVDYIALILDATLCHMEMCASAQERGLQFLEGYVDECDDVIVAFTTMEATMEQVNKEHAEAAAKPSKQPRTKKSDAATGRHEVGNEIAVIGESSRPKRKSTSASGEREASRAKKSEEKLALAAALLQANNLTSKTKPSDGEAMYKSLEDGLGQCFPYGQDPLPCKISADKIHLNLDSNTTYLWRRERSRFNWSGRLSV